MADGFLNNLAKDGQIFGGFVDGVSNVFGTVANFLIKGINKVIATPFNTINGLLNKMKDVNIMGVKPFNGFWGYNPLPVPQIPQLATGGVAISRGNKRGIVAEIGEGRYDEAVIPLENSPQFNSMKSDIANEVADKLTSMGGSGVRKIEIDILAGGVRVGKKIIDLIKDTDDFYDLGLNLN